MADREAAELARSTITGHERVLYGQRIKRRRPRDDKPASAGGRSSLVERG